MVRKLQVQVNHNYENSSLPASECIDRKKITNNREKTGKKLRARKGPPITPGSLLCRTWWWRFRRKRGKQPVPGHGGGVRKAEAARKAEGVRQSF